MENARKPNGLTTPLPLWLPGPLALVGLAAAILGLVFTLLRSAAWGLLLGILYGLFFQVVTAKALGITSKDLAGGRRLRWAFVLKITVLGVLLFTASQNGTHALLAFPCGFLIMRLDFMQKASHR